MYPHCVPGKWVGVKGSGQTEKEVNHPRLQRERERQRQNKTSECNCPVFSV